jgi:hypothetical protein
MRKIETKEFSEMFLIHTSHREKYQLNSCDKFPHQNNTFTK